MADPYLDAQHEGSTLLEEDLHEPRMYKVLLHNDDYTSMDFVVHVLVNVFRKTVEDATEIMLAVHESGIGLCGIYTHEIAETKVRQTRHMARGAGFPLRCTLEIDE